MSITPQIRELIEYINKNQSNLKFNPNPNIQSVSDIYYTENNIIKRLVKKTYTDPERFIFKSLKDFKDYLISVKNRIDSVFKTKKESKFIENHDNEKDFMLFVDNIIKRLYPVYSNLKIISYEKNMINSYSSYGYLILNIDGDIVTILRFDNGMKNEIKEPEYLETILKPTFDILNNYPNSRSETYLYGEDETYPKNKAQAPEFIMSAPVVNATPNNIIYRSRISDALFKKSKKPKWEYNDKTDQDYYKLYNEDPKSFFEKYKIPIFINARTIDITQESMIIGKITASIFINIFRKKEISDEDTIAKSLNPQKTIKKEDIKNCLVRQMLQAYKPDTEIKEKRFNNLLKFIETNNIVSVNVEKHLSDFAQKLNVVIELYSKFGFQYSNEPLLKIQSKNRKSSTTDSKITTLKILIENQHARRYVNKFNFISDYVQYIENEEHFNNLKYDDNTIYTDDQKLFNVVIIDGKTWLYKDFKPYEYLKSPIFDVCYNPNRVSNKLLSNFNRINNIYYKKFNNVHSVEDLQFAVFKDINKIKYTTLFRKEYKYACFPISRHKFNEPTEKTYTEIDQCSAYLSVKQSKNYRGFPKNNSRLIDITEDYLNDTTFNNVSLIHIIIHNKKTNQNIIDDLIIRNAKNLWIPFNLYYIFKKHYNITPTHAILDDFEDIYLSEMKKIFPHLYTKKTDILTCLGKLILNGIKIEDNKEMINPKKKISGLSKLDFDIIEYEINKKNMPYTVEKTITHGKELYNIIFETAPKIKQSVHISTFIYGYSMEIFLNKMLDLEIPHIKINFNVVDNKINMDYNILESNIKLLGIKTDCICIENNYNPDILKYKFDITTKEKSELGKFKIELADSQKFIKLMPKRKNMNVKIPNIPQSSSLFKNSPHTNIFSIITAPGTGKTYQTLIQLPEEDSLIITPTNSRKASLLQELKDMNKNIEVKTIHDYLNISIQKPYNMVKDNKALSPKEYFYESKKKKSKNYSYIVMDEYTLSNKKCLEAILESKFKFLFVLGDPKQCSNPTGHLKNIKKYDLPGYIIDKIERNDNMRQNVLYGSYLDTLRDLKKPSEIIISFKNKYGVKVINKKEDIIPYFDNSLFLGSIHSNNAEINKLYLEHKKSKNEPIKIKSDKQYIESMDYNIPIKSKMTDNLKKYVSYAISINSCQGMTLRNNIIIDIRGLGEETNKIYTALTRSKTPEQIIFYSPK